MTMQFENLSDMPTVIKNDFMDMFCGKLLGHGIGRQVYEHALDSTKVIKIATTRSSFQNVREWLTWQDVQDSPGKKWLAPCHHISDNGLVLIMEKTHPLRKPPTELPLWLSDFKKENYGLLGNQVVCHDYGTNLLLNHGSWNRKLRKIKPGAFSGFD